jgi:Protein of unknown function (DUF3300)
MTNSGSVSKHALRVVCVLLLTGAFLAAQEPAPGPPPAQAMSPEQLDNLVAPIALYPDRLLSQVLVAATYPLEVVEAAQWLQQNRNLRGQQLVDAAREQNWDASIQALVVFPDVLNRLNSDIRWTTDLGNAFLAQQADVMNAVQSMRAQARAAGKLNSSPEERVTTQAQGDRTVIEIQPANPEVVYVPAYNPEYIWGPPIYGYYPPLYYPGFDYGFGFGPGIYIGGFFGGLGWGGWGWGPNWFGCSVFVNPFFFNHYGFHGFYGGGGFRGGRIWEHNPAHRGGVPYSNAAISNRFRGGSASGAGFNRGQVGGQRYGTSPTPSTNRMSPGGNFGNRGSTGAHAAASAPGRSPNNSAQSGGWHRFGESGTGRSSYAGGNRSYAGGGSSPSYRSSPSYGGGNYGASRVSPSYRPSPSYSSGYRPSPSYGGGSYHTMPSYRSSPSYGGGGAYRSSPSYGGRGSYSGGGFSHSSSGGGFSHSSSGGGFHGGGGGGGSFHSGGGGSHGGGGRR